jgi:LPS-assembly lipoprotein
MSSFNRRAVLAMLGLMPLAGCGFQPAYGTDGVAADLQGRVALQDPTERDEFDLVARFEERLGRPNAPIYDLS